MLPHNELPVCTAKPIGHFGRQSRRPASQRHPSVLLLGLLVHVTDARAWYHEHPSTIHPHLERHFGVLAADPCCIHPVARLCRLRWQRETQDQREFHTVLLNLTSCCFLSANSTLVKLLALMGSMKSPKLSHQTYCPDNQTKTWY
jgi:hypothetical protein